MDDVVILGGGVVGLASALALAREGLQVRVLERGEPGCGASHGNCGTITPSHAPPLTMPGVLWHALGWMLRRDAPLYVRPGLDIERLRWLFGLARHVNWHDFHAAAAARATLLIQSRKRFAPMFREYGIEAGFEEKGVMFLFRDPQVWKQEQAHAAMLSDLSIAVEQVDSAALHTCLPGLTPAVVGGLRYPGDAMLRPERYVAGLEQAFLRSGGKISRETDVLGFGTSGWHIDSIHSSQGDYPAKRVLLAAGAWSPLLARKLGLRLPVQPGKGYSITWGKTAGVPDIPLVLKERSVCVTAWADGFRLGSTMEFSGFREGLNRTRLHALRRGAAEYLKLPPLGAPSEEWWGWRPMSVDEVPIIGPSQRWENLHFATAHGMLGVSMSPATAALIADQFMNRIPDFDPLPYAPARFGL